MKVKIDVTQEHIDKGTCQKATKCAVALAVNGFLKDSFQSGAYFGSVSIFSHPYEPTKYEVKTITPENIDLFNSFIAGFDYDRESVKPFSFEIDIPSEYLKEQLQNEFQRTI